MLTLFPNVTEKNAHLAEVESWDDDIESYEMRSLAPWFHLKFMSFKISPCVFFQLSSLHGEFEKVIILLKVGGVVHKEHQEIG